MVSVIVPVHNAAATLDAQLAALAAQDYDGHFEVVVVDNGSTDATAAVATARAGSVSRLRVQPATGGAGASYARNAGAAAAAGEFLAYCDGDDVAGTGWLSALVAGALDGDVVGGPLADGGLNDPVSMAWRPLPPADELPVVQRFLPATASANLGIWADTLRAVGGWREEYLAGYEDVDLCWRAQLAGYRLTFAAQAVMGYRYRTSVRAFARQSYGYGCAAPLLFRDFRDHGMPRSDLRTALGAWKWLFLHAPGALRSRETRGRWVRVAATRVGRLVGSVRHRAFFP